MRWISVVFLVFALIFALQARSFRDSARLEHQQALSLIEADPAGSYKAIEKAIARGAVKTFGLSGSLARDYCAKLAEARVAELDSRPVPHPAVTRAEASLAILHEAETKHRLPVGVHRQAVADALTRALPVVVQTGGLQQYDDAVGAVSRILENDWIPALSRPSLEAAAAGLKGADRRGIGYREARDRAVAHLHDAIRALGQSPTAAGGPLVGPLRGQGGAPISADALIQASGSLAQAMQAGSYFASSFREAIPPEFQFITLKARFNLVALRVAHCVEGLTNADGDPSDYLVHLYVSPSRAVGTLPTAGEMEGAFRNAILTDLAELTTALGRPDPAIPLEEARTMQALVLWTRARYDRSLRYDSGAAAAFVQARAGIAGGAIGSMALSVMDSDPPGCIVLR